MTASRPAPDVTVVVAVYDTMPYLTECLASVLGQTIGTDRLELIAVDDGSTDGSAEELDRFAQTYPGPIQVVHQANSGSPAGPKNHALSLARGRYVFFLDADDYLGSEALERLVTAADDLGSDVMIGRMVGENGRYVHQALYREGRADITFEDSALAWTLSNTKLFRKALIDEHRLRFPTDLPVGSDQPFTIEACLRAARVSVLDSDYPCYHAVRRSVGQSITYGSPPETRLACTRRIMGFVADQVPPGSLRDAILVRHFNWELAKLLGPELVAATPESRRLLTEGVGALLDRYWSDRIARSTPVRRRARLLLARTGNLTASVQAAADPDDAVPVTVGPAGTFLDYPDLRGLDPPLADSTFEVHEEDLSRVLPPGLRLDSVDLRRRRLRGGELVVRFTLDVRARDAEDLHVGVALADRRMPPSSDEVGARRLPTDRQVAAVAAGGQVAPGGRGPSRLTAVLDLADVIASCDEHPLRGVRAYPVLAGRTYEVPIPGTRDPFRRTVWEGRRPYDVRVRANQKGRLVVRVARTRYRSLLRPGGDRWRRGESNP